MLRVGLTGGIGSGKSTVAARLVERGAVLVDSDRIAREVVAPGTPGLAAVVDAFGPAVLAADGSLDRPALAAVVFDDPGARKKLNGIVHPLVRRRSDELIAAAPADSIVVQDIPLLVEGGMAARFPLVVVVHADPAVRVPRLVEQRGMPEADARARIAAQADDAARRAVADVWIDNSGAAARARGGRGRAVGPAAGAVRRRPRWRSGGTCRHRARRRRPGVARAGRPTRGPRRLRRRGSGAGASRTSARRPCPAYPLRTCSTCSSGWRPLADADALRDRLADAGFVPGPSRRARIRLRPDSGSARPPAPAGGRLARLAGCAPPAGLAARRRRRPRRVRGRRNDRSVPRATRATRRRTWSTRRPPRPQEWAASSGWAPSLNGTNPDG